MIKIKVINVDENRDYHAKMFVPGFYKMWKTDTHIALYVYEKGFPHHDEAPAELVINGECYPESIKAVDDILEGKNCTVITYKGQCTVYEGIYGMTSELVKIYADSVDQETVAQETPAVKEEPVTEKVEETVTETVAPENITVEEPANE